VKNRDASMLLVASFVYFSTLKMVAVRSSETVGKLLLDYTALNPRRWYSH
jgi:hypothetical protein